MFLTDTNKCINRIRQKMKIQSQIKHGFEILNENIKLNLPHLELRQNSYPMDTNTFKEMGETFTFIVPRLSPKCVQTHQ